MKSRGFAILRFFAFCSFLLVYVSLLFKSLVLLSAFLHRRFYGMVCRSLVRLLLSCSVLNGKQMAGWEMTIATSASPALTLFRRNRAYGKLF